MLSWIIQISLISIILIFLVHHLIGFFKTTLTVPKIKDLVNSPTQKYQGMFDTISKGELNPSNFNYDLNTKNVGINNSYTAIDLLPTEIQTNTSTNINTNFVLDTSTKDVMKDELKSFLKKQMNTSNIGTINNDFLGSPVY
jgi:Flp pilus assembly protein TadG